MMSTAAAGRDLVAGSLTLKCMERAPAMRTAMSTRGQASRCAQSLGGGFRFIRIWQHSLQKSPDACLNRTGRAFESVA